MNLFHEIQGKQMEELCSSMIRYLVLNSRHARETFLQCLAKNASVGPIHQTSGFASRTEVGTKNTDEYGAGRIDLLIETDDTVIGIEAKFHAPFQDGQPAKYLETLQEIQNHEQIISSTSKRALLFILAPSQRETEINDVIKQILDNKSIEILFLSWTNLVEEFESLRRENRIESDLRHILGDFVEYIKLNSDFFPDLSNSLPHLTKSFSTHGVGSHHWNLLYKIKEILPGAGRLHGNRGQKQSYYGFYLWTDRTREKGQWGWLGFLDCLEIEIKEGAALVFILSSSLIKNDATKVELENLELIRAELTQRGSWKGKYAVWSVPLTEDWFTAERWRMVGKFLENLIPSSNDD